MKVDLNNLIKKEILPNCKGFNYHRRLLFKEPIKDLIAGFCFERIDDHLYLWCFFEPTFYPCNYIYFTFGERIRDSQNMETYWLDETRLEKTIDELNLAISKNIKFVNRLEDVENFYDFFSERLINNRTFANLESLSYTACYLKRQDSYSLLSEYIERKEENPYPKSEYDIENLKQAKLLLETVKKSEEETEELFKEWREFTLKGLDLDKWAIK